MEFCPDLWWCVECEQHPTASWPHSKPLRSVKIVSHLVFILLRSCCFILHWEWNLFIPWILQGVLWVIVHTHIKGVRVRINYKKLILPFPTDQQGDFSNSFKYYYCRWNQTNRRKIYWNLYGPWHMLRWTQRDINDCSIPGPE